MIKINKVIDLAVKLKWGDEGGQRGRDYVGKVEGTPKNMLRDGLCKKDSFRRT